MGGGHAQDSLERSAQISGIVFQAPPTWSTYAVVVALAAAAGLLVDLSLPGAAWGLLILAVPTLIAGVLSAPLAGLLGGTLYYKRAAFIAALAMTHVVAALAVGRIATWFVRVDFHLVTLVGLMMASSFRHTALFITSDNRHLRSLPVSLMQAALALLMGLAIGYFEAWHAAMFLILAVIFLAPLITFLEIFDKPMRKSFHVSASELFRYYLDHLTSGRMDGEAILNRFAEPIRARFGAFGFRRRADGSLKAAIIVPAIHPGPIGRLGGSDLPGKIAETISAADFVMVPHSSATHDFNPVISADVERLGRQAAKVLDELVYEETASPACGAGVDIRVTAQRFGRAALLSYTSWPLPIDDVDFGVGHAATLAARLGGAADAAFIDCHNSLLPGAGGVDTCTPRADAIVAASEDASRAAAAAMTGDLEVGVAQDTHGLTRAENIGAQGVQVLVTRVPGQTFAYILWDGNNALPEVTRAIGRELEGLVDGFQVMTSDNHSVNAVAGSYGPVGHAVSANEIARLTRATLERALTDLEPVTAGGATGTVEDFRVFGHSKTAQLTASINVMAGLAVPLTLTTLAIQAISTWLLFLLLP